MTASWALVFLSPQRVEGLLAWQHGGDRGRVLERVGENVFWGGERRDRMAGLAAPHPSTKGGAPSYPDLKGWRSGYPSCSNPQSATFLSSGLRSPPFSLRPSDRAWNSRMLGLCSVPE